jgi:uncharacterized protein YigE (DUF2233 family)
VSKVFCFLVTLSLLGMLRCARSELAPVSESRPAPLAEEPSIGASAPSAPPPDSPAATPPASPTFETLVAGLSVLSDERVDADGDAHEWIVVRIDLERHALTVRARGPASFADLRADSDLLVAVNGGFFDPQLEASGLLVSGRAVLARERSGGGSGVLAIAGRRARLLPRGARLPAETDFAVQCGPRLIEPDGSIGIRSDDGQRAARTAACIRNAGQELDLVVVRSKAQLGGPGLWQLARWLSEPLASGEPSGCEAALNLDGGPSTGIVVAGMPDLFRAPLGPVPFALVVPSARTAR